MVLLASSIHNVSTRELKNVRLNVKTKASLRLEFRACALLEEDSMSDIINRYMRQCVNEAKARDPVKFEEALAIAREDERKEAEKKSKRFTNKVDTVMVGTEVERPGLRPGQSASDVSRDIYAKTGRKIDGLTIIDYINGYELEKIDTDTQEIIRASLEGRLKQIKGHQAG